MEGKLFILMLILIMSISYYLTYIKTKRVLNPVGLIVVLWFVLLIVSNFSFTGLYVPSFYTQLLVIIALVSTVFGAMMYRYKRANNSFQKPISFNILVFILFVFGGIAIGVLFYKALMIFLSYGNYIDYILNTRSSEDGSYILFGSGYFLGYINNIAIPIAYASLFIGVAYFFVLKKNKLLVLSILIMSMYTLTTSAREALIIMLLVFLFGVILYNVNNKLTIQKLKIPFLIISIIFSIILWVSYERSQGLDILNLLTRYIITNHTVGFTLFDLQVQNQNSYLNENFTYGRASFGFIEQFISAYTKLIDRELYTALFSEVRGNILGEVVVGVNELRKDGTQYSNAFYTSLYPLYLDFRILGLMVVPFIYGFYFMKFYLSWKNENNLYAFTMTILFIYIGYSSVLMPILLRPMFYSMLFYIWIAFNYKKLYVLFPLKRKLVI